jgi:hypothetical protein
MDSANARLLICLLVAAGALAFALPADALSCTSTCGGECTGQCTINSIGCSVACTGGGCPGDAECYEYGETVACHHSTKTKCVEPQEDDGPPGGPETQGLRVPPQSEWAVVTFRTDDVHAVDDDTVQLVAASTPRFGGLAIDDVVRSSEEAFEARSRLVAERRAQGESTLEIPRSLPIFERVHFMVAPAGPCERVEVSIPSEAPKKVRGGAFFKVIVSAEGEVSAVSPLYVEGNTNLEALSRFLREEGRLHTTEGVPVEAFLYLRSDDAGVSYISAGGSRLL